MNPAEGCIWKGAKHTSFGTTPTVLHGVPGVPPMHRGHVHCQTVHAVHAGEGARASRLKMPGVPFSRCIDRAPAECEAPSDTDQTRQLLRAIV
jgi:hypothetical protein